MTQKHNYVAYYDKLWDTNETNLGQNNFKWIIYFLNQ